MSERKSPAEKLDRRDFLIRGGASFAGLPLWFRLGKSGAVRGEGDESPPVLVVCELAGGNDGLNTVVPIEDDAYHRARPKLRVAGRERILSDGFALHPRLGGVHTLWQSGQVAIQHGVGYPHPNRSHFRSMDIWHSATPELDKPRLGWLGRAADDLARAGAEMPAIAIGSRELPLVLRGTTRVAPAVSSLAEFELRGDPAAAGSARERRQRVRRSLERAQGGDELDRLLAETATRAIDGAEALRRAARDYRPATEYPRTAIGRSFELAARVLAAPLGVRILWLQQGGYDTHAGQERVHPGLLGELDAALHAFANDTRAHGTWDRCRVLVHSEFGRRLAENQSRGTDHGAAASVLLLGGRVRGGLHGKAPSLTKLDDGDPIATCDFRGLYAEQLRRTLGVDAERVLGAAFQETELLPRRRRV